MTERKWTDNDLIVAVRNATSIASVIKSLHLNIRPGNYATIKKHISRLGLDISHFLGKSHGSSVLKSYQKNEQVFVKDSTYSRSCLKNRIVRQKLLPYKCSICERSEWNQKPLVLIIDHINGVHNDHRLENLRFLCPNCNSQQPTFCRGSRSL